MYLDLGAYERKDDRLEYDPHLLEDGGHRVILAPARLRLIKYALARACGRLPRRKTVTAARK